MVVFFKIYFAVFFFFKFNQQLEENGTSYRQLRAEENKLALALALHTADLVPEQKRSHNSGVSAVTFFFYCAQETQARLSGRW